MGGSGSSFRERASAKTMQSVSMPGACHTLGTKPRPHKRPYFPEGVLRPLLYCHTFGTVGHMADEYWVEMPGLPAGWKAEARLVVQDGQFVIAALTVKPKRGVPRGGLTIRALRGLRIPEVRNEAHADLAPAINEALRAAGRPEDQLRPLEKQGRGRPRHSDGFLACVAACYVLHVAWETRRPTADLAAFLDYEPKTLADLLGKARKRGLLTEPPPGRAGGELTAKGRKAAARFDARLLGWIEEACNASHDRARRRAIQRGLDLGEAAAKRLRTETKRG